MTDFNKGVITSEGLIMSKPNTPTRVGEIIESLNEIDNIPNPFVNMKIWVKDENCEYRVLSLKSKKVGSVEIKDAVIDTFEKIETINPSDFLTKKDASETYSTIKQNQSK